ncbi:MAG: ABC transporter transmembrane domain-containing protein, partial [Acidobacteria bacterium]|nr:ABC transporter transmembrane domain-containing protein [Acidobacteriota bacterium]
MRLLLRLGSFMRPYASRMVAASVLLAFAGGLMSLVIASMKPLVDLVLLAPAGDRGEGGGGEASTLLANLRDWLPVESWSQWLAGHAFAAVPILLVVIFVLRGVVLYAGKYMTSKVGVMMIRDIRAKLHAAIWTQSLSFFKEHPSGELMSRVFGDVQR